MTPGHDRDHNHGREHEHDREEFRAFGAADGDRASEQRNERQHNEEQPGLSDGLSSEEEVLRRLLHETVRDLQPSPNALEHLRRAIPARRAHRRQAIVGMAASLLLAGTAVPALVHTANTSSSSASAPNGGSAQHSEPGGKGGSELGPTRGPGSAPSGGGQTEGRDNAGKGSGTSQQPSGQQPGRGSSSGFPGGADADAPECVAAQLTPSPAAVGAPDADGRVRGTFRVVNASQDTCSVSAPGQLTATARGNADPARITVVVHKPGDPATELPDVAAQPVVLAPGSAFVVEFAWIPESGTNGCTSASDPGSGGSTGGTAETEGGTPQDGGARASDGTVPGSVELTYTPAAGGASASGQIAGVCAGTVYHTPPMADG